LPKSGRIAASFRRHVHEQSDSRFNEKAKAMSKKLILPSRPPRRFADVALLVTTALVVSLAVAAIVVSIGIARATIIG
jgi:hypothetical protein